MNISSFALNASRVLRKFPRIHTAARRIYCLYRPGIRFSIEQVFRNFDDVFVLKIGACDGVGGDPIAEFLLNDRRYRGLLVEPIPLYAKMLSANYEGTGRFKIEQAAIATTDGKIPMFYVDENATDSKGQALPQWLGGVSSLSRAHVAKHLMPEMHAAIRETTVDCLSVATLLTRNKVDKVDLLQIDAEGYDYVVLRQFNLSVIRPKVVICERKHLLKADDAAAKTFMEKAGYEVRTFETDFLCIARQNSV